jgi:hypothetical protein
VPHVSLDLRARYLVLELTQRFGGEPGYHLFSGQSSHVRAQGIGGPLWFGIGLRSGMFVRRAKTAWPRLLVALETSPWCFLPRGEAIRGVEGVLVGLKLFEEPAGSYSHAHQRVVCQVNRDAGLLPQPLVQQRQLRSAAGQNHTSVHDV